MRVFWVFSELGTAVAAHRGKSIMQEKYLAFLKAKDLLNSKFMGVIFAKVCL